MTSFAEALSRRESPVVRQVRRVLIVVACVVFVQFWWGIYRRIVQVMRIEVTASSLVIVPGTSVGFDVITSGEVPNLIRLELVQGPRREVLHEQAGGVHRIKAVDPRLFRHRPTLTVSSATLAHFQPGPATLRVTGFGGQKLLRTPPPRIRELGVRLQP